MSKQAQKAAEAISKQTTEFSQSAAFKKVSEVSFKLNDRKKKIKHFLFDIKAYF
jgi:hypothetical protein